MRAPAAFDRMTSKPLGDVSIPMGLALWAFYGIVLASDWSLRARGWFARTFRGGP